MVIYTTPKMDTHGVSRLRRTHTGSSELVALARVFSTLPLLASVASIAMDGLFTTTEQQELAARIPDAELVVIKSPDGHDGLLLEFERVDGHIQRVLRAFP